VSLIYLLAPDPRWGGKKAARKPNAGWQCLHNEGSLRAGSLIKREKLIACSTDIKLGFGVSGVPEGKQLHDGLTFYFSIKNFN
jgi:hypothetical protein